jgi:hypothetical protein
MCIEGNLNITSSSLSKSIKVWRIGHNKKGQNWAAEKAGWKKKTLFDQSCEGRKRQNSNCWWHNLNNDKYLGHIEQQGLKIDWTLHQPLVFSAGSNSCNDGSFQIGLANYNVYPLPAIVPGSTKFYYYVPLKQVLIMIILIRIY